MINLVWRFPFERLERSEAFPDELLCIPSELRVSPNSLLQSRIWMLAEMGPLGEFLFGHLVVERGYVIKEGINRDHIVLIKNRSLSFRLLPHDRTLFQRWRLGLVTGFMGLAPIEEEVQQRCIEMVRNNDTRSFSPPPAAKLAVLNTNRNLTPRAFTREAFWNSLSQFALGDLERWETYKELTPFAVLVFQKCKQAGLLNDYLDEIKRLDGSLRIMLGDIPESLSPDILSLEPDVQVVDTMFTTLDPDTITTRHYLRTGNLEDDTNRLAKTQEAETNHQAILRDIASYLISKRMCPLQSRSIDLAQVLSSGLFLAEVKSANQANFMEQAEKGLIQLIRYEMAIEENGLSVKNKALIMEAAGSRSTGKYIQKLAQRVGSTLLLYEAGIPWPDRVVGLLELMGI